METIRKYWFMIFLAAVLVACVLALLVPSWDKEITRLVSLAFVGLLA